MTTFQNALDYVQDKMSQGVVFENGANVEIIRMMGIRVVPGKIMAEVRKELNAAVKIGYLGRLKKTLLAPEIYFHPNSRARAIDEQKRITRESIEAIKKVCV